MSLRDDVVGVVQALNRCYARSVEIRALCLLRRFWQVSQGSKDPNNRVLGPKYCVVHSIGALKPYDLGPGTLSFGGAGFMMKG